ncbi:hypothetical protein N0V93_004063 [Gnomoniopsis smithogilvyi]|uniref:3-hydroxyisobutyrate dehydrogenase n=1 Tax=Gnomoniopsis smithogilvyi TaxID=1191159 RepID=A0A9W9D0M2_9PEZI|nr:hypothetical protein N0V93_004063 [Gnomoniopsis smithogilvyi]
MSKPIVGYIGLGHAGYPMASCLAKKGYILVVYDADSSPTERFVHEYPQCRLANHSGHGGILAHGAFRDCSIIITMLPNGTIVRDVLLGEDGIATGLNPGSVVVDMSSSSPFDTRNLGHELDKLEISLVDSPITQKELHAIDRGGATLMVGSDSQSALDAVLPVLRDMSTYVFPMGKLGTGHTMKTLNNYVSVGSIIGLCDALVTGQKLGLDAQQMIDVLNCGTGVNF